MIAMSLLWQNVLTGAAAGVALAWLIRDRLRKRAAKAGCASCALMQRPPVASGAASKGAPPAPRR